MEMIYQIGYQKWTEYGLMFKLLNNSFYLNLNSEQHENMMQSWDA